MEENTKNELNGILEGIDKEIAEKQKTVISAQAKAQIKNLIDKVDVRKKLPDFSIVIPLKDMEKQKKDMVLTLSDFLHAINTEATTEDKQGLKNLQVRADGLRATLEMEESEKIEKLEDADKVKGK